MTDKLDCSLQHIPPGKASYRDHGSTLVRTATSANSGLPRDGHRQHANLSPFLQRLMMHVVADTTGSGPTDQYPVCLAIAGLNPSATRSGGSRLQALTWSAGPARHRTTLSHRWPVVCVTVASSSRRKLIVTARLQRARRSWRLDTVFLLQPPTTAPTSHATPAYSRNPWLTGAAAEVFAGRQPQPVSCVVVCCPADLSQSFECQPFQLPETNSKNALGRRPEHLRQQSRL